MPCPAGLRFHRLAQEQLYRLCLGVHLSIILFLFNEGFRFLQSGLLPHDISVHELQAGRQFDIFTAKAGNFCTAL